MQGDISNFFLNTNFSGMAFSHSLLLGHDGSDSAMVRSVFPDRAVGKGILPHEDGDYVFKDWGLSYHTPELWGPSIHTPEA